LIERLAAAGPEAPRDEARTAFATLRQALSDGSVRAAEPDPSSPSGWKVNAWVKRGILLGFRFGDAIDMSADHGKWPFFDKDTLPLKPIDAGSRVRVVPGGSTIRDGAYLGRGVICMPPMYVNIGAWVGDETLIDSHALVGSCAQIGSRVHLSAAAQIGGVLEPVGALPVIIEDDVLVGGNCGVYEGAIVKRRAVLAAGTILTRSTPLYDLPNDRIIEPEEGQPLVIPEGAVVVPGTRPVSTGRGREWGLSVVDADHREVPRREDRRRGRHWNHGYARGRRVRAAPHRHRFHHRPGAGRGRVARGAARRSRLYRRAASSRRRTVQRLCQTRSAGGGAVDYISIASRRSFRATCATARFTGAARAMPRASWRRRLPRPSGFAPRESAASDSCSSSAKSVGATAPRWRIPWLRARPSSSTANRPTTSSPWRPRGVLRLRLTATGRAAHSAAPHAGESAIDKLMDALIRMRTMAWPSDPDLGQTFHTIGFIEGGIAPNVISPSAWAEVMFRIVGSVDDVLHAARTLEPDVRIEEVLRVPMVRFHTVEGVPTAVFPFTTDVPFLDRWGTPLLFGPGSFLVAHTDREHLTLEALSIAIDRLRAVAERVPQLPDFFLIWSSSALSILA